MSPSHPIVQSHLVIESIDRIDGYFWPVVPAASTNLLV